MPEYTIEYMKMFVVFFIGFFMVSTAGFLYGRDEAKAPDYKRDALLSVMVVGAVSIGCCMGALIFIHKEAIGQIVG